MAACYTGIITLDSGAAREGQFVQEQVPHLGECVLSWTPLEDPDEGVWSNNWRVVLHYSDANRINDDCVLFQDNGGATVGSRGLT